MLIDSHCHLDDAAFSGSLADIIARAGAAGVGRMVTIGCARGEFDAARTIANEYEPVYAALGVHPHEAEKEGASLTPEELAALTCHPKVIGLGETGLDYFYDHAPRDAQQRNFRAHIRACKQTGLPLIVHTRQADEDTLRVLEEEGTEGLSGVFHCFSSGPALAAYGLKIGFFLSFSGMITFNKSENVRAIAREVPLDRLLVETDAPYLAPTLFRGKTCEPAHVVHTARKLAEIKGVSFETLEEATTENFFRLFRKARP